MNESINITSIPGREEFLKGCEEFEKHEARDAMYKVATFLVSHFWGRPADIADGLGVLLLTWNQAFYRYGIFDFDELEKCITDSLQKLETFRNRDILSLSTSDEDDIRDLFAKFLEALQIDSMRFSDKNKKRHTKKRLEELLRKWNITYDPSNLHTIYTSIKDEPRIRDAVAFARTPRKEYIHITISKLGENERNFLRFTKLVMKSPVSVSKALHLLAPNFFPLWDDKIARAYNCYYDEKATEKYVLFCKITKSIADRLRNCIDRSDKTLTKLIDEYNYSKYTREWI